MVHFVDFAEVRYLLAELVQPQLELCLLRTQLFVFFLVLCLELSQVVLLVCVHHAVFLKLRFFQLNLLLLNIVLNFKPLEVLFFFLESVLVFFYIGYLVILLLLLELDVAHILIQKRFQFFQSDCFVGHLLFQEK